MSARALTKAFVRVPASVIVRPPGVGAFEFVILAALRTSQLMRGCVPRIDSGHKATVTAQLELSSGKVTSLVSDVLPGTNPQT
jgi:DNA-directed RNA polymerase subunit K/omega